MYEKNTSTPSVNINHKTLQKQEEDINENKFSEVRTKIFAVHRGIQCMSVDNMLSVLSRISKPYPFGSIK